MVESGTGLTDLSYDGGPFDAIHLAFRNCRDFFPD
jgi:hypothetical protein